MLKPLALSSDVVGLVSDMLLEGALLIWVTVSIYMSTRFLRDRGMIILLVAGLLSFVVGALANIYDHIRPVGLWRHVFFVDFAHCGGYIFLSSSVGYLVVRYMRLHEALEREALTDSLTGLYNRRFFYQRLEEAVARYQRYGEPFGVAVLDVDELKEVNDRYGHLKGDEVLKEIARALNAAVRATDSVARFGGDEFVILFSGAANEEGVVDRLLKEVDKCSKTASIGVSFCPRDGTTGDELVAVADKRMYAAKAQKGE
ncbi:MAG: GGDEF domain-containing protein [Bacillota bacterium]